MKKNDRVELLVGPDRNPTIDYPHVHVIHHGDQNVDVVASASGAYHPWRLHLENPDGNTVENAITAAWAVLAPYSIRLMGTENGQKVAKGSVEVVHTNKDRSRVLITAIVWKETSYSAVSFASGEGEQRKWTEYRIGQAFDKARLQAVRYHGFHN